LVGNSLVGGTSVGAGKVALPGAIVAVTLCNVLVASVVKVVSTVFSGVAVSPVPTSCGVVVVPSAGATASVRLAVGDAVTVTVSDRLLVALGVIGVGGNGVSEGGIANAVGKGRVEYVGRTKTTPTTISSPNSTNAISSNMITERLPIIQSLSTYRYW
jgi:hypothetical protein